MHAHPESNGTGDGSRDDGLDAFNALPAEVAAARLLECLAVPRWAREIATGRPYDSTPAELAVLDDFFGQFGPDQRGDAYGPERPAGPGATPLDHAIARSGRDPAWTATR